MSRPKREHDLRAHENIAYAIVIALILLMGDVGLAHGSIFHNEGHVGIRGDQLYVVPQNGRIHKIRSDNGDVVWVSEREHEELPLRGNSYTRPFFADGGFLIVDMDFDQIVSVDCETGRQVLAYAYDFEYPWERHTRLNQYKMFMHDNLLVVWKRYSVRAINLEEKSVKWEFGWARDNVLYMHDCWKVDDKLHLLNSPAGNRFEVIELDCSTGEVLDRTKKQAFFEHGGKLGVDECFDLGNQNGTRLVFLSYKKPTAPRFLRFYAVGLSDKSVTPLIEQMAEPAYPPDGQGIWPKPIVSDSALFYRINIRHSGGETGMLVARSLPAGETLWKISETPEQTESERPFLVDGNKLFTVTEMKENESHHIICRDASTGKKLWTADLQKFSPSSLLRDMKAADRRLYVLSDDFMRALDGASGREIWKTQLWGISRKGIWRRILDSLSGSSRVEEPARQTPEKPSRESAAPSPSETMPTIHDVERFLKEGNDIAAIKAYRRIHGVGLADAKAAVDAMKAEKARPPALPPADIAAE